MPADTRSGRAIAGSPSVPKSAVVEAAAGDTREAVILKGKQGVGHVPVGMTSVLMTLHYYLTKFLDPSKYVFTTVRFPNPYAIPAETQRLRLTATDSFPSSYQYQLLRN